MMNEIISSLYIDTLLQSDPDPGMKEIVGKWKGWERDVTEWNNL